MATYLAHSRNDAGISHLQAEHLAEVARLAASFAAAFGAEEDARFAGLLHDLGKYGDLFQQRLRGEVRRIDHWSMGAWCALQSARHAGIAAALAIHGHHLGLQPLKASIESVDPRSTNTYPRQQRLSDMDLARLSQRFHDDGLQVAVPAQPFLPLDRLWTTPAARMLDIRMLFSALVDADYLDTERHFNVTAAGDPRERPAAPPLAPERALDIVLERLAALQQGGDSAASTAMLEVRAALLRHCLEQAAQPAGTWTLTAPTGSGKTLAMLAFALKHAATHHLRRVVMVIPYLSIIEQTARVFRAVFEPHFGDGYLLEHHSLAGTRAPDEEEASHEPPDEQEKSARLMTDNWDAPLIVTTSVQLLESLFAHRPSACRKLHRLAQSVILFDEVQSLPARLAIPTLATLSHLSTRYGASVVFSTATQPAFNHLDAQVRAIGESGWQPREVVACPSALFREARRTTVQWPDPDETVSWDALAEQLAVPEQVLCIVNRKDHAAELLHRLRNRQCQGIVHLSTAMCPAHRQHVLAAARVALDSHQPCRLIATQCLEAGVDVDFPLVYRAFGPLEAIAQAAGRCNRHGRRPGGEVRIFTPDLDERAQYPKDGVYRQAAAITRMLLRERGSEGMDIHDPELFKRYYRRLYELARPQDDTQGDNRLLYEAIQQFDFPEVARLYRLIPKAGINVLVPYDAAAYDALDAEARGRGLTADWIRRAQPHAVSLYEYESTRYAIHPVPIRRGKTHEDSTEWFILRDDRAYDGLLGLSLPGLTSPLCA